MTDVSDVWITIICRAQKTLKLYDRLDEFGIEVWTPIWNKPTLRGSKRTPLIPMFVFYERSHHTELTHIMNNADKLSIPHFSLFRINKMSIAIESKELDGLRNAEYIANNPTPEFTHKETFAVGDRIEITGGALFGRVAIIAEVHNKFLQVEFMNGAVPMLVPMEVSKKVMDFQK